MESERSVINLGSWSSLSMQSLGSDGGTLVFAFPLRFCILANMFAGLVKGPLTIRLFSMLSYSVTKSFILMTEEEFAGFS